MNDKTNNLEASALKGLAHPVRLRLVGLLDHHGPATATQLAAQIGENTGSTSYHLRQLARHGLIEDIPGRGKGKERWWRSRAFDLDVDRFRRDPETAEAAESLLADMIRQRGAELTRWMEESRATPRPWLEAGAHKHMALRLTREELADLTREVSQVLDAHHERARDRDEKTPDTARVIVHFDVFPVGLGEQEAPE
ncbi:Helix-turn-helix domain-containing protein [Streptosporangium subroseum]|uniref:Helix-turn-helix domain-containing protein n=1 Tax=Streptosporangium subroseum TaxID=106412 RepID=A0A239NW92_9ACTN|nr:helix-turn-helix domain-containing protein [Streptosporangium subroseum]SNT59161.1 Helix-turn-helix domain-containing protein [Streptosporangium subroseum]